jgi:hypothetical protein
MCIRSFFLPVLAGGLLVSLLPSQVDAQPVLPSPSPVETSSVAPEATAIPRLPPIGFNELLGLMGVVLALAAIPPVASRLWRRGPRLAFQARSDELLDVRIQPFIESIRVRHGRRSIERLTLTTLVLWNAGRDAVRAADLDEKDPLRFQFEDNAQILEWKRVAVAREGFTANLMVDQSRRNELILGVPYLNPGDGLVVDIWHTGSSAHPHPRGSIQGPAKWFESRGTLETLILSSVLNLQIVAAQAMLLSFFLIFLVDIDTVKFKRGFSQEIGQGILYAISILLMVPQAVVIWTQAHRLRQNPPHSLSFAAQFESAGTIYRIYRSM